jgi:hypothetical protein
LSPVPVNDSDESFVIVSEQSPGLNQFGVHHKADTVAHLRPIEPYHGDGAAFFVDNLSERFHVFSPVFCRPAVLLGPLSADASRVAAQPASADLEVSCAGKDCSTQRLVVSAHNVDIRGSHRDGTTILKHSPLCSQSFALRHASHFDREIDCCDAPSDRQ